MKPIPLSLLAGLASLAVVAGFLHAQEPKDEAKAQKSLKYYIVKGTPKPEVVKSMVDNPVDLTPGAEALVSGIPGAKLVGYYLVVGKAQNYAIIAVPDSTDAAAITYQRMATGALDDIEVIEVIPSAEFVPVLEKAKGLNEKDAFLKK